MTAKKKAEASAGPSAKSGELASKAFADINSMLENLKVPGIDLTAIADMHRKDMEALAEANRQAVEGMRALAERHNEILKESLAEWRDAMSNSTLPADVTQRVTRDVQRALSNVRELAAIEAETRTNAWKVVQDRFKANMEDLGALLKRDR